MRFTLILIAIAIVLYCAGWLLPVFQEFAATWTWAVVVVGYGVLTGLLHRWLTRAAKGSANAFVTAVNGSTAAKMLLSMVVVTVYLVAKAPHRVEFALGLFVVFLANTLALVLSAQRVVRSKTKN